MWNVTETLAQRYEAIVKKCLTDEESFRTFRANPDYLSIVGTPSPYQYSHFWGKIKDFPEIIEQFDSFRLNDKFGTPPYINGTNNLSMGTIRYIHSLCDLKRTFGTLDNMVIAEIGVGYGGLAFILSTYFKPKAYHLIDLPDVQSLAMKYLKLLNVSATAEPPQEIDLFISEFCLSEFSDDDLYKFYEKYVRNARNVYLQMNLIDENRKINFIEFMTRDFKMEVRPETHGTGFPAYVIVGKK